MLRSLLLAFAICLSMASEDASAQSEPMPVSNPLHASSAKLDHKRRLLGLELQDVRAKLGVETIKLRKMKKPAPPGAGTTVSKEEIAEQQRVVDLLTTEVDRVRVELQASNDVASLDGKLVLVAVLPAGPGAEETAWMFDLNSRKRTVLRRGSAFRVGPTSATVEEIEDDRVSLKVNDERLAWKLGQHFTALIGNGSTAEASEPPPVRLRAYPLGGLDGETAQAVLQTLLDGRNVRIAVDPVAKKVIVLTAAIDQETVRDALQEMQRPDKTPEKTSKPRSLSVYPLNGLDPKTVLAVLEALLEGHAGVRLAVDPVSTRLLVVAPRAEHMIVEDSLQQMQRGVGEPAPNHHPR